MSEAVHVRRHSLGSSRTHGLDRDPLIVLRDEEEKKKNGALTCRRGALPVLLHPSDGFVLVELSLELVLLQG